MPLHLLFLTHYFPPEGNAPASRVFELCRRWVKAGHQVTVITGVPNVPDGKVYAGYRNRWRQTEDVAGIRVIRVWTYLAPNKGTVRRIANYVSFMVTATWAGLFVTKPDLIIATSPQFFCGWAGAILKFFRRRPFILEIRDIWPESIRTVGAMRNRGLIGFLEWLEQRLYAAADHIVTVGAGYQTQLQERGVPQAKISVVMNGVDRELFSTPPSGDGIRQKFGLTGKFVCAYIGTVGMACGLQVVIRAAARLKQQQADTVRFLIVGDGALLATLRQEAQRAGLDNIIFTGLQPKETMPAFLAATDACLVHLKKQDLFNSVMPSKIFEALAMRRPIILGVQGFAAEFIRQSGGGVCIEPENEAQLLQAVARFQTDPVLAERMGSTGCEFVLKHFDRDTLAQDYLNKIKAVLASPPHQISTPLD